MKANKNLFFIILIIILFALLALEKSKKPEILIKDHYTYETDTISIKKYKKLKVLYDKKTPPKTVVRWRTPPTPKNITIEKVPDSILLIIKGLKEKISISDNFIKLHPLSDKLLEFKLNKDTLNITLLNIKGLIRTNIYPIYLDNYKYQWIDNQLKNSKFKIYKEPKKFDFTQLYLNIDYDYLNKYNTLTLDYHLKFGRVRVGTEYRLLFNNVPGNVQLKFKIGYRLFK